MNRQEIYLDGVNAFLEDLYRSEAERDVLFQAMQYSLLAGGKRIRPILLLEFCRVCGGNWENALPAAAAV